jgi:primosomal protein N' (replication factor Y)
MDTAQGRFAEVLLPLVFDKAFDYGIPDSLDLQIGSIVLVPFGPRQLYGVVEHLKTETTTPPNKLKLILDTVDWCALIESDLAFLNWMASYTLAPRGQVLKMMVGIPAAFAPERSKVVDVPSPPNPDYLVLNYSPDQQEVVDRLREAMHRKRYETLLIDGVTGSGKTEVYLEAVAEAIRQGKQSVVLLPEISLTPQWLERFRNRFGSEPLKWHSHMTPAQRRKAWRQIVSGQAKVVVGARSALMLPYPDLGLIVVDEEHDTSYKQEEGIIYNARDMAVARGYHRAVPVVLVSATPSLETYVNAKEGKYTYLQMPYRHGEATLPKINLIDMKQVSQGTHRWLSPPLIEAMRKGVEAGEQTLLFLNRRGYAPLTLCRACGERLVCPNCTAWLVQHKANTRLQCHHCAYTMQLPPTCPGCEEKGTWVPCGPGVERLAEEVKSIISTARLLVMSSDLFDTPDELHQGIDAIQRGEVDIIIGTQIMAKGHHFPKLTVVGIIDADTGLSGGDLRACEKTFQLLQQVSGRCGRAEHRGEVFLQTYSPDHAVMQALLSDSKQDFFEQEILMRRQADMPPYTRLAAVICSSPQADAVEEWVRHLRRIAPQAPEVEIWGPAPAPLAKIRCHHRWRFLVRTPKNYPLQQYLKAWLGSLKQPHHLRVHVDIDPLSFV